MAYKGEDKLTNPFKVFSHNSTLADPLSKMSDTETTVTPYFLSRYHSLTSCATCRPL